MKRVFNDWNKLNPDQEFSYDAYHLKELNSRAFEYQSIKDDQLNKEFWRDITTIAVFVVAGVVAFACPPVGVPLALSLGVVHGILEMGSAISGKDWISGRELSAGERWFRGALSPLDIIPGVAAVKRYSGSLKILNRLSNLGKTGKATPPGLNKVENIIQVAQKEATARIRKVGNAFKDAQRVFKEKTIEVAQFADKSITKAKNILTGRETVAVNEFGEVIVKPPAENTRYFENFARDRFNMPTAGDVGGSAVSTKISKADRMKLEKWDWPPSDELYLTNKHIYDDPKYFNQETGVPIYPGKAKGNPHKDGFLNGNYKNEKLTKGTIIDRYGDNDSGKYFSPDRSSYESRALPPFMKDKPYERYEVLKDFEVKLGEVAPWFGETGGGKQFYTDYFIKDQRGNPVEANVGDLMEYEYIRKLSD